MSNRFVALLVALAATFFGGAAWALRFLPRPAAAPELPAQPSAGPEEEAPATIDLPITSQNPTKLRVPLWVASLALLALLGGTLGVYGWLRSVNVVSIAPEYSVVNGNADRGRETFIRYGCGGCHAVPGLAEARGRSGPSLDEFAEKVFIAGRYENNAENLILWIMVPQELDPLTAMPSLGVSESHARDIAAYLYTLR